MQRESKQLDCVLVPLGLAVMVGYHVWLLLRIRRRPTTTVIGINAINRRIWVRYIMEEASGKHAVLAVQTMRNSIMASTVLASVAITLSSLVAVLMASDAAHGLLSGEAALSVKFFAILVCFLVAFLLNVQSIRYYSHTDMKRESKQLDCVLVPLGLAVMVGYHLWLLLRIRRRPATTVIGINAINRRIWVRYIMEEASGRNAVLAVQTMRNSIMASTVLASVAITLSSLVAVLMASDAAHGLLSGEAALSVKFFAILVCFLVAFLLNVQSIRYYSHTGILVNVPLHAHQLRRSGLAVDYVTTTLNRGSYFWSLGVRAFYFSCPVFLWLFGPIPMFASCVAMVCALYSLDVYKEWERSDDSDDDDGERSGQEEDKKTAAAGRLTPQEGV